MPFWRYDQPAGWKRQGKPYPCHGASITNCTALTQAADPVREREHRRKVMLAARLQDATNWDDVVIVNVSARGMGICGPRLPARGAYVEVRRKRQLIVARVVWSAGNAVGLRAQDPICIDQLVADQPAFDGKDGSERRAAFERRQAPRAEPRDIARRSVERARTMHFVSLCAIACIGALLILDEVGRALGLPLERIAQVLESGPRPNCLRAPSDAGIPAGEQSCR